MIAGQGQFGFAISVTSIRRRRIGYGPLKRRDVSVMVVANFYAKKVWF